uniref:Uncharacterized protein n=1 Tax=Macrostomum lignano TaxID=282301 RepID=A0A1I8F8V0_9PLAT
MTKNLLRCSPCQTWSALLVRWKGGKRCAIICKEADKALPDSLKHGKLFLDEETKPFAWLPGRRKWLSKFKFVGMEKGITRLRICIYRRRRLADLHRSRSRAAEELVTLDLASGASRSSGS